MSKTRKKKSTIDCSCNKLIDWLTFKTTKSTIDWMSKIKKRKSIIDSNVVRANSLINWFSKQENRLLSRFIDMKMLYVNFSLNLRKRHVSWSLSKRTFVSWRFVLLLHSRRFVLLLRRFSTRKLSFVFSKNLNCKSNEIHSSSSKRKLHILTIYFIYSRISTSNLFCCKTFYRISINLAKFKTRNLLCKRQWIILIASW